LRRTDPPSKEPYKLPVRFIDFRSEDPFRQRKDRKKIRIERTLAGFLRGEGARETDLLLGSPNHSVPLHIGRLDFKIFFCL
jgi:hypothetical protein